MCKQQIFGLKELIAPLSTEGFLEKYWLSNEWAFIASDIKRFESFPFIARVLELDSFISSYKGRVSLIHRDRPSFDVQGGDKVLPYFNEGYTVYFRDIEDYLPEVKAITRRLAADLAMPGFTAEIFASSGISGVGMHSDYHLNLNLLLSGEKEWMYAKNTNIVNQTSICLPNDVKQVDSTQLKYVNGELHSSMPSSAKKVTQKSGDLMFVPRGWWHTTRSIGNCLSLNFIFKKPTWARLFTLVLEQELLIDPRWREYPHGVNSHNVLRLESAMVVLEKLIDSYKKELDTENAGDMARKVIDRYLKENQ